MDEALKPCPFCGGSWVVTHRPANGSQPHISCKECNASGPLTAGMTEAQWRAAWNTRADAAPTPKADEVEAVARAIEDQLTAEDGWMVGTPALSSMCHDFAQAAAAVIAREFEALEAENARLREVAIALHGALAAHTCYGCPACLGDCSSANPPMMFCPTAQAQAAYFMFDRAALKDTRHDADA